MLHASLQWVRSDGLKLHPALRHRLFSLYRPPRWLPCWFHSLWYYLVARFVRLPLIVEHDGNDESLRGLIHRQKCRVQRHLGDLSCYCLTARVNALQHLCGCHGVRRVWLDGEIRATLDKAVPAAGARLSVQRYSGAGVTVAVVDTGIHPHPDVAERIIGFADMVGNRTAPYDDNGHGTHVAGCVAASGARSGGTYRGVAPRVSLVGVKVLNKLGSGTMSGLLAGIDWVIQHRERYGIRILSMSLGGTAQGPCGDDPLCRAAEKAWQAGIVVVVAAGNEGPETGTIGTPGISPRVITVGAMDDRMTPDRGDDQIAPFSSRGPAPGGVIKPDLLAPGVSVTSLRSPRSTIDKENPGARVGEWYLTLSGTSMATPIVAGVAALLLEAEPGLSPDEVKRRLVDTAQDWGLPREQQGAGYLDADRAVAPEG